MKPDFEVRPTGYIPSWRKATKAVDSFWVKAPLALCSVLAICLLLIPNEGGYRIPLSVEWAMHSPVGYYRLFSMELTLAVLSAKLWIKKRPFDASICLMPMFALGYLASSPPFSYEHFMVFAGLALTIEVWHWALAAQLEDFRLYWLARFSLVAAIVCFVELGLGERLLCIGVILAANLAFYDYA
jgi:hypothetical protein